MAYKVVSEQIVDGERVLGSLTIPARLSHINRTHLKLTSYLPFEEKKGRMFKTYFVFTLPEGWTALEGPKNSKNLRQYYVLDGEGSLRAYVLSDGSMLQYNHIDRYSMEVATKGAGSQKRYVAYTYDHKIPFLETDEDYPKKRVGTTFAPARVVDDWIERQNWVSERLHKVYGPYEDLYELWDN